MNTLSPQMSPLPSFSMDMEKDPSGIEKTNTDVLDDLSTQTNTKVLDQIKMAKNSMNWKDSERLYKNLLQEENIDETVRMELQTCLDLTQENLIQKKIKKELELEETRTKTLGWNPSLPKWKTLAQKYQSALQETTLEKYKDIYTQKAKEMKSNTQKAEILGRFSSIKKKDGWKKSVSEYSRLLVITQFSKDLDAKEKKEILQDLTEALELSKINTQYKESNKYLLQEEEKYKKQGYRKSQTGWKYLHKKYLLLSNKNDIGETKYQKIFEKKAKEMEQNHTIALLNGKMEDLKESNKPWQIVQNQYALILKDTLSSNIPHEEKQSLLWALKECQEICESNITAKEIVNTAEQKISLALTKDWDQSKDIHKEIEQYIHQQLGNIKKELLTPKRKLELYCIQTQVQKNITLCTKNTSPEKEGKNESIEELTKEYPHIAYLLANAMLRSQSRPIEEEKQESSTGEPLTEEQIQTLQNTSFEGTDVVDISQSDTSISPHKKKDDIQKCIQNGDSPFLFCSKNSVLVTTQSLPSILSSIITDYLGTKGKPVSSKDLKNQLTTLFQNKIEPYQISSIAERI